MPNSFDTVIGGYCHQHTSPKPCAQCAEDNIMSNKLVQSALLDAAQSIQGLDASYVRDYLVGALPILGVQVDNLEAKKLVGCHLQPEFITFFTWNPRIDEYSSFSLPIVVTKFNRACDLKAFLLRESISRLEKEAADLQNQHRAALDKLDKAKAELRNANSGDLYVHLQGMAVNIQPPTNQLDA